MGSETSRQIVAKVREVLDAKASCFSFFGCTIDHQSLQPGLKLYLGKLIDISIINDRAYELQY